MGKILIFGYGYTGQKLSSHFKNLGWQVVATSRDPKKYSNPEVEIIEWNGENSQILTENLTHIIYTIPPVQNWQLPVLSSKIWKAYYSSTGVYGDHQGNWVDENSECRPENNRSIVRFDEEKNWKKNYPEVNILRLAGIYGSKRNILEDLISGTAKRIFRPDIQFGRIHLDDILGITERSIFKNLHGEILNLCDDLPAPQHEIVEFAAGLLKISPPPLLDWTEAEMILSEMAKSFYTSRKKVSNQKAKRTLDYNFINATYKEGLERIFKEYFAPR